MTYDLESQRELLINALTSILTLVKDENDLQNNKIKFITYTRNDIELASYHNLIRNCKYNLISGHSFNIKVVN